MNSAKEVKLSIIELLIKVNDLNILNAVYNQLENVVDPEIDAEIPSFFPAIISIRKNVSLHELMQEQNYKPISYQQFRAKTMDIQWEESLDELLDALH